MKRIIKKHWFFAVALLANLIVLFFSQQTGLDSLSFTGKNFLNFLFMLAPVFICIGLMDIWVERDSMIKIMGEKSGFTGIFAALLLGAVTAVPLYALLPIAGILLKKGSRILNVLIFLCASASIRIPLLFFEISSLGWQFTVIRFGLNIIVVFSIAFIIEKLLSEGDRKLIYENVNKL